VIIIKTSDIDFSKLMDLRVDYAFKLFFATKETHRLISLLNAIFENKQIPRIITELSIVNPSLEKAAVEDKLSVLDIRAKLADGTNICIEMHLYDVIALKFKTLRSWARVYGEELQPGQKYRDQNMVICISFAGGHVTDISGKPIKQVHSLFQVMERDSHEVLVPDMELHYINMKAFIKNFEQLAAGTEKNFNKFTKWLILISQKEIKNKEAIMKICAEKELEDAMRTLTNISQDKIARQAYQRRLDELHTYNEIIRQIEAQTAEIADKDTALADKDAALADKDLQIANLLAQLIKT
jgi:predicted transposase/invertase (TIGR01784 family)